MEVLIDLIIPILIVVVIALMLALRKTRICDNCGGTMYSFNYTGDGDGPDLDHVHYKCNNCNITIEVLA